MALINDPDSVTLGQEVIVDTTTLKIGLQDFYDLGGVATATNLNDDGITGQALYSFLKEAWKDEPSLIPYPFPMISITPEQFEFVSGWEPANDKTREFLRFAGWRELDSDGNTKRDYMNVISLGDIDSSSTAYYKFQYSMSASYFDFTGPVNQGIKVYGADSGDDYTNDILTLYLRTSGNTYDSATSTSIGLNSLNYIANRFPLSEDLDTNIFTSATDFTQAPYDNMTVRYTPVTRSFDGGTTNKLFDIVIDGNNGTSEEIYNYIQSLLNTDGMIDFFDTQNGLLADEMLTFVGDNLLTSAGVYIDNFAQTERNRITFTDKTGAENRFPFVSVINLNFNQNLVADGDAKYFVFFADTFGTDNALLVRDNDNADITGDVANSQTIQFTYDYDNSSYGGATPASDVAIKVVAIGLNNAQHIIADHTIIQSSNQSVSLVAPLERNYEDPE